LRAWQGPAAVAVALHRILDDLAKLREDFLLVVAMNQFQKPALT
jgi:hypothetical protein